MNVLKPARSWSWSTPPPSYSAVATQDNDDNNDDAGDNNLEDGRTSDIPTTPRWRRGLRTSTMPQAMALTYLSTFDKQWQIAQFVSIGACGLLGFAGVVTFITTDGVVEHWPALIAIMIGFMSAAFGSQLLRRLQKVYASNPSQTLEQQQTSRFITSSGGILFQLLVAVFQLIYALTSPCIRTCDFNKTCRIPCSEAALSMQVLRMLAFLSTIMLVVACVYNGLKLSRRNGDDALDVYGDEDDIINNGAGDAVPGTGAVRLQ